MERSGEWLLTGDAARLTGYSPAYLRRLATRGRVEARKVGRDWLLNKESLLAYRERMKRLGGQRYNPWRDDLVEQGRGRRDRD